MDTRMPAPVARAAIAIMLLGACADDGPTTLAKGEDIELVGTEHLGGRTLNIDAEEEDGVVTGEFSLDDNEVTIECADAATDGVVILGGVATAGPDFEHLGDLYALIIREGDPASVSFAANDSGAATCTELLESLSDAVEGDAVEGGFVDVENGYDIQTG